MPYQKQEVLSLLEQPHPSMSPDEIPNLDLYMDQIISLFDDAFPGLKEEKRLTKSMINNYSKDGVLKPIKGKKYTREHVLRILLIYELKQTLPISEIKTLMDSVEEGPDGAEAITRLIELHHSQTKEAAAETEKLLAALTAPEEEQNALLISALNYCYLSHFAADLCKKMIALYASKNSAAGKREKP